MNTINAPLPADKNYYVYIIRCADGSLYTGYTTDVARRIAAHNSGKGAKYTKTRRPVALMRFWRFTEKGQALRAEAAIKSRPKAIKERIITEHFDEERLFQLLFPNTSP